jgi:nickel superoxide dismutase
MRFSNVLGAVNPLREVQTVAAHCDVPCGVYNPAQARIEAESVQKIAEKYQDSDDEVFRQRCVLIKEERAELVKHHLWVLWTDYFKPNHLEEYPQVHELFWKATKAAGEAKKTMDPKAGTDLLAQIDEISAIFWATKGGKPDWMSA